jgi:hypothetical protein
MQYPVYHQKIQMPVSLQKKIHGKESKRIAGSDDRIGFTQ